MAMISQQFNPAAAFEMRAFSPNFTGNRDGIGADRARLMVWADDAPFFLQGAQRDNAVYNSPVVDRFLRNSGSVMAITPSDAFRKQAGITLSGAVGALDLSTGQIYIDSQCPNGRAVRVAARLFARAQRRNALTVAAA